MGKRKRAKSAYERTNKDRVTKLFGRELSTEDAESMTDAIHRDHEKKRAQIRKWMIDGKINRPSWWIGDDDIPTASVRKIVEDREKLAQEQDDDDWWFNHGHEVYGKGGDYEQANRARIKVKIPRRLRKISFKLKY